ncbi:MoxR family ATPase [Brucella sp. NBRC 12950]|uniref:AAA family ATPase n=1 Tax=Brucella sp. NBRC 12950 TaxID=2994518 RepID=UPI0024A4CB3E|nr:MoxR family ATPase [Brucella sp. NBRC 12950]GLU29808.1 ATPase [Brucella sp. NBRC 12950]
MAARDDILKLGERIEQSVIGQKQMIERLLLGLISNGHILVEGLPGLAKTRAIKSLAKNLESELSRIQFTPDLLPADVTGSEIYVSDGSKSAFKFQQGPIFANLVLADEINRAPAKVQSGLLEAMEERQVTVGGKSYRLPDLFMVMATQNPIEQEGTYPLPEAQLDRFLLHIRVDYPDEKSEAAIMRLNRSEEQEAHDKAPAKEKMTRLSAQSIFDARKEIGTITVSEPVEKYMVALVFATRYPDRYNADLAKLLQVGVSPRGVIGLDRMSRAYSWLKGRDFVTPDDVKAIVHDVFRHRLLLSYEAHASNTTPDQIIDRITELVAIS